MLISRVAAAFVAVLLSATLVQGAETKPAIVFDTGGKFDKSFNEGAANGAERFKKETGIEPIEFEVTNDTQFEQAHRRFAQRGSDLIIGVGFAQGVPVEAVAKEFPAVHFTIINAVVKQPNVQSVLFKEQEGLFLVGIATAMASKTGKIGFVGGMDIPLIRRFACGYVRGAKYANPSIEVIENMTGTTPAAWNDPARGGELAKGQFDRGVDVVYAAAGGTGIGVYQMAKDARKLAIGVSVLGLKEGGVDWAVDQYNEKLITPEIKAKVGQAKTDIIDGKIKVQDYMEANACSP
jgi:basic membrane protein A and related proteins